MTRVLLALLAAAPAGRIAGKVDFAGPAPRPQQVKSACAGAAPVWEQRALVRLTTNVPPGPVPAGPVTLEARGCRFEPWLQGAVKGQKIALRNRDGTTHSVRAAAQGRVVFNVIQAPDGGPLEKDPILTGVVTIGCDLHPWMKAFVVVSEHPYFAVTADDGAFEINDVPPGRYGIEAWNDRLGVSRAEVTVEAGAAADPKLSFRSE